MISIDGGSDITKTVVAVFAVVDNPRTDVSRQPRITPKTGKLSVTKGGEQKMQWYLKYPEDWVIVRSKTIKELIDSCSPCILKIEPNYGSYPRGKDKARLILYARSKGFEFYECDPNLTSRRRAKLGIPYNAKKSNTEFVDDAVDAAILYVEPLAHFGKSKLPCEKRKPLDRVAVKEALENAEESGWDDELSRMALATVSTADIEEKFGQDLASPVFIVTAYAAAQDPQCINRREFDRFCGLNAKSRLSSKQGIGSVISSNLSHFNDNPQNVRAARYIRRVTLNLGGQGEPRKSGQEVHRLFV